jgi:hypothetical protein
MQETRTICIVIPCGKILESAHLEDQNKNVKIILERISGKRVFCEDDPTELAF